LRGVKLAIRLPHPVILLLGGIVLAALLTWVLPAGEYERRDDEATGRRLVIAGTYRAVQPSPVGPMGALMAVPRGLLAGADVIVSILFVGGAFALVEQLGTLARAARAVIRRFHGRGLWAIPVVALVFGSFGALENMQEEIIALVPVLLVLGRGLGVDPLTMVAASYGSAAVGAAFGPSNPFQAGIALKLAQLPLLSGGGLRLAMLAAGLCAWVAWTLRHAARHRTAPTLAADESGGDLTARDAVILLLPLLALVIYVVGVLRFDFGFNELSAFFFLAAILIGIIGRLGLSDGMAAYLKGMEGMVGVSVLIGVARGISVVLSDGRVIDTVVHGLASPLEGQAPSIAALLMIPIHAVIHVAVPSVSGQAALTMPILVPFSDLVGLSRQATVVAYQTGAGLAELFVPTNAALMAILLSARVPYPTWIAFAARGGLLLLLVGIVGTLLATRLG
jgi:uncharacterized ion transporter superfamily protein YfcC